MSGKNNGPVTTPTRFSMVIETPFESYAGTKQTTFMILPDECIAMRPDTIVFDDAADWDIERIVIGQRAQPLGHDGTINARELMHMVNDDLLRPFETIQTRMGVEIVAIPKRDGLKFRCQLSGEAALR